jgi:hypothetical protein
MSLTLPDPAPTPSALAPTPAPPPSEAWALANPPAGASNNISWVVMPEEQVRQWQKHTEWLTQNMEAIERSVSSQERNATTFEQQKAEMVKVADAAAKMAASLDLPVPTTPMTNAQLAAGLLLELAPVMPTDTPKDVMLRVQGLIHWYRLFYSVTTK